MNWVLNWKELENYVNLIRPRVEGLFVDRILIPERPKFPDEYIKDEWILKLSDRTQECFLLCSARPRHPYLAWQQGRVPKASTKATSSSFITNLSKNLKGARLRKIETLPRERVAILWFRGEGEGRKELGLVLKLIPAVPEAFLIERDPSQTAGTGWPILSQTRMDASNAANLSVFTPPDGSNAPPSPALRQELFEKPETYFKLLENELESEGFTLRLQRAEKTTRQLLKQAKDRLRQSETALKEAENEKNWNELGTLLKASMGDPSARTENSTRYCTDYNTGETITIALDPKLTLQDQVEKFFQNSRRRQRRIQESSSRAQDLRQTQDRLDSLLSQKLTTGDWPKLENWEKIVGIGLMNLTPATGKKSLKIWQGKAFVSQDGSPIWVGRNTDENLDLTFKYARGNDLWMHARGRPSAHIVIPLSPGKSASLSTLLDAAQLILHYSKGTNWGKTEIDYTFKKYVKRIKNSKEVTYAHNKTLLVDLDPSRLKKLLDQVG